MTLRARIDRLERYRGDGDRMLFLIGVPEEHVADVLDIRRRERLPAYVITWQGGVEATAADMRRRR